jgi:hypothetical protein
MVASGAGGNKSRLWKEYLADAAVGTGSAAYYPIADLKSLVC